jgi:tetratricopeptide (TPR) repeat protein
VALTHQRLALVRQKKGDLAGSAEAFRTAITHAPRDAELHASLAAVLLQDGKPEEALAAIAAGEAVDPRLARLRFIRAQCLDALGRGEDASAAWRDYIAAAASLPDEAPYVELARRRLATGVVTDPAP